MGWPLAPARRRVSGAPQPPLRVTIVYDPPPPFGGVRVSAAQTTAALAARTDLAVTTVPFHGEPSVVRLAGQWLRAMRAADVVLFQGGDILSLLERRGALALRVAATARCPVVFRGFAGGLAAAVHALPARTQTTLRRRLRRTARLTAQTRDDWAWLAEWLGADGPRVEWLPNVRPLRASHPSSRTRPTRFLFVGALDANKGLDTLVSAAERLTPGIEIVVMGHAQPGSPWPARLAAAGIPVIAGKGPDDVSAAMADADALVLPTQWAKEGHPGVVLEAFACGRPVIASRWNGIPDLVDASCGVLIPPGDAQALAAAIQQWHDEPSAWRLAEAGAAKRAAQFEPAPWTTRLSEWLHDVARSA
jgi:glycosyltransferase involved in cell wall biosynthesis